MEGAQWQYQRCGCMWNDLPYGLSLVRVKLAELGILSFTPGILPNSHVKRSSFIGWAVIREDMVRCHIVLINM